MGETPAIVMTNDNNASAINPISIHCENELFLNFNG